MSNKSSFESKVMDFYTNAPFDKIEVVHGLVKEIFKRRKAQQAEESLRLEKIAGESRAQGPKVKVRKRRTKAQMSQAQGELRAAQTGNGEPHATPPPITASA